MFDGQEMPVLPFLGSVLASEFIVNALFYLLKKFHYEHTDCCVFGYYCSARIRFNPICVSTVSGIMLTLGVPVMRST